MKYLTSNLEKVLLEDGVINKEQLDKAKEVQKNEGARLEDAIVKLGYVTQHKILQYIAVQYNLTLVDLNKVNIPPEIISLLSVEFVKKHGILPVSKTNGVIIIAVSGIPALEFIDNMRFMLNADVKCVLAPPEEIKNAIDKYYKFVSSETIGTLLKEITTDKIPVDMEEIMPVAEVQAGKAGTEDEAPIIQLVSLIINRAIASRASDIHVEPFSSRVRVRYRIDGVCVESDVLPKRLQDQFISRIKIMSGIDIAEKRRPQDGRINIRNEGKDLDIRVSCLPSIYGESVVMRLLEKSSILVNLKNLGFSENDYQRFNSIIKRPNGILLITGPTGSGKTTTLYAAVNEINKAGVNIITAEDPVEYTLYGINQSEVNEKIGLNFPAILRTMLRQDPNVILVGEIRDEETADIAIAAALTGHLVLSTLHTNDAPSSITRLMDMGIKPFLVSTSLQGILAQRLVRMICGYCKEPVKYSQEQLLEMGFDPDMMKDFTFFEGKGCKECHNIGYHGRLGIYELLDMNETLRDMTYCMASTDEIRKAAIATGMKTLRDDGIMKVNEGKTSLSEVFRVIGTEE